MMNKGLSKKFLGYAALALVCVLAGTLIGTARPAYRCDCNRDRFERGLISLGREELTTLINEDHGAEVNCYFCNKTYRFTETQLRTLLQRAQS